LQNEYPPIRINLVQRLHITERPSRGFVFGADLSYGQIRGLYYPREGRLPRPWRDGYASLTGQITRPPLCDLRSATSALRPPLCDLRSSTSAPIYMGIWDPWGGPTKLLLF